mgnify:CR=1
MIFWIPLYGNNASDNVYIFLDGNNTFGNIYKNYCKFSKNDYT